MLKCCDIPRTVRSAAETAVWAWVNMFASVAPLGVFTIFCTLLCICNNELMYSWLPVPTSLSGLESRAVLNSASKEFLVSGISTAMFSFASHSNCSSGESLAVSLNNFTEASFKLPYPATLAFCKYLRQCSM